MTIARLCTTATKYEELKSWTEHLQGCPGWQISWRPDGRKMRYDILLSGSFTLDGNNNKQSIDKLETLAILKGGKMQRLTGGDGT